MIVRSRSRDEKGTLGWEPICDSMREPHYTKPTRVYLQLEKSKQEKPKSFGKHLRSWKISNAINIKIYNRTDLPNKRKINTILQSTTSFLSFGPTLLSYGAGSGYSQLSSDHWWRLAGRCRYGSSIKEWSYESFYPFGRGHAVRTVAATRGNNVQDLKGALCTAPDAFRSCETTCLVLDVRKG